MFSVFFFVFFFCKEYAFLGKMDSSIRKWSITKQIKLLLVIFLLKKKERKKKTFNARTPDVPCRNTTVDRNIDTVGENGYPMGK